MTMPLVKDRIVRRLFPSTRNTEGPVKLTQRRVYILPTRQGLLFVGTLALMLIGSVNYNLSLGFVLTFLLFGLWIVTLLHTWRNLAHVSVRQGKTTRVFAGELAAFEVQLVNTSSVDRVAIALDRAPVATVFADISAHDTGAAAIHLRAERRGVLSLGRFRISTTYPLGLFRAWGYVELPLTTLVYPAPEPGAPMLPQPAALDGMGGIYGEGSDDFSGLRNYYPGDSLRHIAWKAAARSDVLLTKQFSGRAGRELLIDWALLPTSLGLEEKLSRLTSWVVVADEAGLAYAFRIPGVEFPTRAGTSHRDQCLEALALFQLGKQS